MSISAIDRINKIDKESEKLIDQIVEARLSGKTNESAINKLGELSLEKVGLKKPSAFRAVA